MRIKQHLALTALLSCMLPAFANSSTVNISEGVSASYFSPAQLVGSWHDTVTFEGLSAGKYNVKLGFTGSNIDVSSITLNGLLPTSSFSVPGFSVYAFTTSIFSPFKLDISGSTPVSGPFGLYTGSISAVAAVPEPETYALALTALGCGLLFHRRSRQKKPISISI